MQSGPRRFEVAPEEGGARLDRFLAVRLGLSRRQARKLLAESCVTVGGRPMGEGAKGLELRAGEVIEIESFTPPDAQEVAPEPALEIPVLAEGPGWLAVDKPAGMPVHPLDVAQRGTVLNALVAQRPGIQGVGEGALRSGVVHRLDVDTSGALLVATAEPAWQRLRDAFREHRVAKRYLAVVAGAPEAGCVELPLVVAEHRPARVRVATGRRRASARSTRTRWRSVRSLPDATLLEVEISTGFLHQIRVTLAHLGHPVLGDRIYGDALTAARAPRQLLHATRLAFEEIEATCPPPPDFSAFAAG